jgi:hypothetical protein
LVRVFADRLPIDDILPKLDAALSLEPNLVLVALPRGSRFAPVAVIGGERPGKSRLA